MYYPQVEDNNNTRNMISQFMGYNHNHRIGDGEFYNMENLSTNAYPVLCPRDIRPTVVVADNTFRGSVYTDGSLAYMDGNIFHYSTWKLDLTRLITGELLKINSSIDTPSEEVEPGESELKLIRFGAYILIYQLASTVTSESWNPLWVNVETATHEAGIISPTFTASDSTTITYAMCTKDGESYDQMYVGDDDPTGVSTETVVNGYYWLSTREGSRGLYVYYDGSWSAVATTYIRINVPGAHLKDYFSEGDTVYINSIDDAVKEYNNGSAIVTLGDNYFVIIGLLEEPVTRPCDSEWQLTIYRKMPVLDYICVDKNRVWGCRYGYSSDGLVNEIYATKLGDFKNWYSFQGLSTDSYSVSIGVPGAFTGCISYGGYPTFFKESAIFRVYGSYPAEYSMTIADARGVQKGSHKSLAIVGETLFYKAPGGVMAFDGSLPVSVSTALGKDYYFDGIAGVCGSKYYLEVSNNYNNRYLFVYDTELGIWTKESALKVVDLCGGNDGQLYSVASNKIYRLGRVGSIYEDNSQISEEYVSWYGETGELGFEYPDSKYVSRISVRAYIPHQSEIEILISYDDRPYDHLGIMRGDDAIITKSFALTPYRCDHYKLKISGHGAVKIYTITTTLDTGSEEYGYKN